MRRTVLIIIILAGVLTIVHGQEKTSQPQGNRQDADKIGKQPVPQPPIVTGPIQNYTSGEQCKRAEDKPKSFLSRLISPENVPNIGLLIAGIFGICVARKTLRALQKQSAIMATQSKATRIAAEATKDSADAAQKQIRLSINKERARIRVEPQNFKLNPNRSLEVTGVPSVGKMNFEADPVFYKLLAYVPTPAFIKDSKIGLMLNEKSDASIKQLGEDFGERMAIGEIIDSQLDTNQHGQYLPEIVDSPTSNLTNLQKEKRSSTCMGSCFTKTFSLKNGRRDSTFDSS